MVKGRIYKIANLDKNKKNKFLTSYTRGRKDGIGWLWTANWVDSACTTFKNGDPFVALGKKVGTTEGTYENQCGITTWYEALGPDGNIHRFTPSMRSTYFRNP